MTLEALTRDVLLACAALLASAALGMLYFDALRRTVAMFAQGRRLAMAGALTIARIGLAAALLLGVAQLGAAPLIGALLGFLLARTIALRAVKGSV